MRISYQKLTTNCNSVVSIRILLSAKVITEDGIESRILTIKLNVTVSVQN